jgi:hypothetical protein
MEREGQMKIAAFRSAGGNERLELAEGVRRGHVAGEIMNTTGTEPS